MYHQSSLTKTIVSKPTLVTGPTSEPITLSEAKRQLFLAESDTSHDAEIVNLIQAAREQWERDTDTTLLTSTLRVTAERLNGREVPLPSRPIQSVTSFTYFDENNVSQTLSTSIYSLDSQSRAIRLTWNESWPVLAIRWDAVTITYVAGLADRSLIPAIAKQAMLLLIGYYGFGNKGDNDRPNDQRAYESLVLKFMRSSYP
jgi:uncharacterized phiE125 gp8 family phage protein